MAVAGRDGISQKEIRAQLDRILSSSVFSRSERMKRFLTFVVEQSLVKDGLPVKEYSIALAVYDKPDSFDPRLDPIVRVEASRLRAKLREYYEDEGGVDPVTISIRKKGYSAICKKRRHRSLRDTPVGLAREVAPGSTRNPEAQHLYLKGRHYWNRRSPEAIDEAAEYFKQAVAVDSQYAHAYAGLADCYASQSWLETDSPSRLWRVAEEAVHNALAIDESLAQASTTLACKQALYDWNWTAAEASFRNSIAHNPQYATARHWYGIFCLAPQRRLTAALSEIASACELDPLSSVIGTHLGCILYFRRQYREAIEQYQRALEVDPSFHLAYWHMGFAYAQISQYEDALRAVNQSRELGRSSQATTAALGYVYAGMGRTVDAEHMLNDLEKLRATSYVSPVNFALICTAMNDLDAAFRWLVAAREERASRIVHIKVDPAFDRLKTDSRLLAILSSLNLL